MSPDVDAAPSVPRERPSAPARVALAGMATATAMLADSVQLAVTHLAEAQQAFADAARGDASAAALTTGLLDVYRRYLIAVAEMPATYGLRFLVELGGGRRSGPSPRP